MLRLLTNTIKQIVFIPLFIFSSAALSETLMFNQAINLIDENGQALIPENYTAIGSHAFRYTHVTKILIPDSIETIGPYAFADTPNLREVILPSTVSIIPNYAFYQSGITEFLISDNITEIGERAFYNSNLETIEFSDNTVTGTRAFSNTKIKHLQLPNNFVIGQMAFSYLDLSSISIGENVTTVGLSYPQPFHQSTNNLKTIISESNMGCPSHYNAGICFGSDYDNISNLEMIVLSETVSSFNSNVIRNGNYLASNVTIVLNGETSSSTTVKETSVEGILLIEPVQINSTFASGMHSVCENIDTDNDGHQDCYDQFPSDPDRWFDYGDESNNTPQSISNDSDSDGILDIFDTSFSQNYCYEEQSEVGFRLDTDQDGVINRDDCDDDNDGLFDIYEPFFGTNPLLADSDFDGTLDGLDAFPMDNTESLDTDSDGIGNNTDTDDDNDGYTDFLDAFPLDANEWMDSDSDGIGNNGDLDDDNDGVADAEDAFPYTASESVDTDGDGIGDNSDAFPNDSTEWADADLDGIGNNTDTDDDNDGVADLDDSEPLDNAIGNLPSQIVAVNGSPKGTKGHPLTVSLTYDSSDNNNQLTGLGYRVHFDSSYLSYRGAQNIFDTSLFATGQGPYQDIENFDGDTSTDSYIVLGWAAIMADWPNVELPIDTGDILFDVNFEVTSEEPLNTVINFSKTDSAIGYDFESTAYDLSLLPASWDFDGNGSADALTDGLMLMRYAFGIKGLAMTENAVATDAALTPEQVVNAMDDAMIIADIDDNGGMSALTDGLILLRYLFGLREDVLINSVIDPQAARTDAAEIESYIEAYMPGN